MSCGQGRRAAGKTAADVLHIPYAPSTAFFAVALAVLLVGILCIVAIATVASLAVSLITSSSSWVTGPFTGAFAAMFAMGGAHRLDGVLLLLAYAAAEVTRSAAVGIGFGIGSTLAEVVLTRIFLTLGGVWQTVSQRFPHEYTENMITRVDPGTPSAGISLLAIALYNAVLVAAMLVAVRVRDVTA